MNVIYIAIVVVAGYLLGSLSISILLSKNLLGRDVRRHGSGNAGATNMARVFGMCAGLLTLAGDMLKAAAAMLMEQGAPLPDILRAGVAAGTATVTTFGKISFTKDKYEEILSNLRVSEFF